MEPSDPRSRILEVALALFDEHGYAATSMDAIRRAAGFRTKSSLYAHFPGKEALSQELFRRVLADEAAALASYVKDAATATLEDLLTLAERLVEWGLRHRSAYRFCYLQWHRDDPPLTDADRALANRIPDWALTVLRRLQSQDPHLRQDDPALLIDVLQGIINQIVVTAPDGLTDVAIRHRARQARELCAAILRRP